MIKRYRSGLLYFFIDAIYGSIGIYYHPVFLILSFISYDMNLRKVGVILKKRPTLEGAGVRLNRIFGFSQKNTFDPFLLLDDFSGDNLPSI